MLPYVLIKFMYLTSFLVLANVAGGVSTHDPRPGAGAPTTNSVVVELKRPDYLLFMATAVEGDALRNHMIPCLMESLRNLRPYDCMTLFLIETAFKMRQKQPDQVPVFMSTLDKKFCLGKDFRPRQ